MTAHIPHSQVVEIQPVFRENSRAQLVVTEVAEDLVFITSKGQKFTVSVCVGDQALRALVLELNSHLSSPLLSVATDPRGNPALGSLGTNQAPDLGTPTVGAEGKELRLDSTIQDCPQST